MKAMSLLWFQNISRIKYLEKVWKKFFVPNIRIFAAPSGIDGIKLPFLGQEIVLLNIVNFAKLVLETYNTLCSKL